MLQAFIDDSISSTGDRRLYLAAYVHTADAWAEFSDAWDEELKREPAIPHFKMAEAQNRSGQFRGFSEAKRNQKVFALARVIRRFMPWGIHASVSIPEFNALMKPFVPYPMGTPYFALLYAITYGVARIHSRLAVKVPCDFIFDNHDGLPGKVLPFWDLMGASLDPAAKGLIGGSPIFRDDKDVLPLQAADMLAWNVRRAAYINFPKHFAGLSDLIVLDGAHFELDLGKPELEALSVQFKSIPGVAQIATKAGWASFMKGLGDDPDRFFQPPVEATDEN